MEPKLTIDDRHPAMVAERISNKYRVPAWVLLPSTFKTHRSHIHWAMRREWIQRLWGALSGQKSEKAKQIRELTGYTKEEVAIINNRYKRIKHLLREDLPLSPPLP